VGDVADLNRRMRVRPMSGRQIFVESDTDPRSEHAMAGRPHDLYHVLAHRRVSARVDGGHACAVVAHSGDTPFCFSTFGRKSTKKYGMPPRHMDTSGQSGRLTADQIWSRISSARFWTPARPGPRRSWYGSWWVRDPTELGGSWSHRYVLVDGFRRRRIASLCCCHHGNRHEAMVVSP
jgi:hypothetical protein